MRVCNDVAIFVDFENLRKGVFEKAAKQHKYRFNYNENPQQILDFCNFCVFYNCDNDKRISGIQTGIILFEDIKPSLEQSLYKHCDIVKKVKVRDVYSHLGII